MLVSYNSLNTRHSGVRARIKMNIIILSCLAAVFSGLAQAAPRSRFSFAISEDGTRMETIDERKQPEDSVSTDKDLRNDVAFNIFTRSNKDYADRIYLGDDESLSSSYFDPRKPTRFFIHGWQSDLYSKSSRLIRQAYLSAGDYNVIVVDWSAYAGFEYVFARTKVVTTGTYIGRFIDYLENRGINLDDLIIVGHSLGAHIAGVASRTARNTVASVIALDPAGPLFYFTVVHAKLRSTDAEYVQVIHTNAGILGYDGQLGDADFWPNSGKWQAGCKLDVTGSCSHSRSYKLLAESIASTDNRFIAYNCHSYDDFEDSKCTQNASARMGGATLDTGASGQYYLDTNSKSPYAMGS